MKTNTLFWQTEVLNRSTHQPNELDPHTNLPWWKHPNEKFGGRLKRQLGAKGDGKSKKIKTNANAGWDWSTVPYNYDSPNGSNSKGKGKNKSKGKSAMFGGWLGYILMMLSDIFARISFRITAVCSNIVRRSFVLWRTIF